MEFVQDVLDPPVIALTDIDFELKISGKSSKELWFVDFYTPWCPPCMQMMSEWRRFAKKLKGKHNVNVASIDCQAYVNTCRQQGVSSYPTMRLYPVGWVGTSQQAEFQGWYRNVQSFLAWAQDYLPTKVISLANHNFRKKVLSSREPWIIDFYANWCGPCQQFASEYEKVAEKMEGVVNVGRIDCAVYSICSQAYIQGYPTLRFYRGSSTHQDQDIFGIDIRYTGHAQDTIDDLNLKLSQYKIASRKDEL